MSMERPMKKAATAQEALDRDPQLRNIMMNMGKGDKAQDDAFKNEFDKILRERYELPPKFGSN